jgi:starvation-inducible outer membrane lipoprotein
MRLNNVKKIVGILAISVCFLMVGCQQSPKLIFGIPQNVWKQLQPEQQQQVKEAAHQQVQPR